MLSSLQITSTVYSLTIIFVLINLLPGLIDLHCVVQVPELMHIDILLFINLPFLWNTIPFDIVDSTSYGAFKSRVFLPEPGALFLCCCSSCRYSVLCMLITASFLFPFFVIVASCT